MYNPSLRQIPRHEPAEVIPLKQESSLLEWLEATGRLLARDNQEPDYVLDAEPEITDLMGGDDSPYDDLDDDVEDAIEVDDDM
ncbi:DUF3134 domain-containing protein [Kamptonema animale CS-326]|jgi:hypothetical protein|uniref:DUF3134 domain-containing protein n=1 Tax=Kamptonema TaxID=1501433 RepID=UPI0001DACFE7|nr:MULTISPECIES: DUF3134 domain-containing protein [Kamptonema]MDB9514933.1 DUF3134 domain-containing protein [Kamptonema animale CS-326]CBN54587.1 conserved hypothetical protein [Kamptonema sp. PCC 6506]